MADASEAVKIIGVIVGILGASCFISSFVPETIHTYKTKNTVGINKFMFFLHLLVGIFFFWGGVFLIALGIALGWSSGKYLVLNGTVFTTLNLITSSCCLYTYVLKIRNMKEAAKLNLTEQEHYEQVCVPFVKSKMCDQRVVKSEE